MKILAVTACPTGIAHTYMAAEMLEKEAKSRGLEVKVETQGAMGIENEISDADVSAASGVIIAADIEIEMSDRFDSLKKVNAGVQQAIKNPGALIDQLEL